MSDENNLLEKQRTFAFFSEIESVWEGKSPATCFTDHQ